jgi:hypothetical protein
MGDRNTQQGRGGLGLLVVLAVLVVGAYLAWNFVHQEPSVPLASTSAASNASAHQKTQAIADAQAQAQRTGRAVSVVQTFSDAELSSLANDAARTQGLPVDQISLHATGQGTVQGRAQAHVGGQTLPVSLEGVPVVTDNRVALNVTSTQVGAVPLPGALTDNVTSSLKRPLQLGETVNGFQQLQVRVTDGQVSLSGVAEPTR